MLREISSVRQIKGEPTRRWFFCSSLELTVWVEDGCYVGFQLAYDKPRAEKAVTWQLSTGDLRHTIIDDGEGRSGKPKSTPVVGADLPVNVWNVCGHFLRCGVDLPEEIRFLVCSTLIAGVGNA